MPVKKILSLFLLLGLAACASVTYEEREWAKRDAQKLQTIKEMIASRDLPSIDFESDKALLLPTSYPTLNKIAQILIDNRTLKLIVEGHCDDVGSDEYNDALSYARAQAVKNYLTGRGVWPDYIKIYGYGERKPLVNNTTEAARALNRRVEFELTTRNWQAIF